MQEYKSSNPYPPTFIDLEKKIGENAWILDVGGGDRSLSDRGYINLDIKRYDNVDILADAHFLPFRENAFDLILCQAILEHLRKPWVAADEIHRVSKVGGFIYAENAFLQPYHAYPNHYFNTTRAGLETLFEKYKKVASGVQYPYQMPANTLLMILKEYIRCFLPTLFKKQNVEITNEKKSILMRIGEALLRILTILDRRINPKNAEIIANGVFFLGKKQKIT